MGRDGEGWGKLTRRNLNTVKGKGRNPSIKGRGRKGESPASSFPLMDKFPRVNGNSRKWTWKMVKIANKTLKREFSSDPDQIYGYMAITNTIDRLTFSVSGQIKN